MELFTCEKQWKFNEVKEKRKSNLLKWMKCSGFFILFCYRFVTWKNKMLSIQIPEWQQEN